MELYHTYGCLFFSKIEIVLETYAEYERGVDVMWKWCPYNPVYVITVLLVDNNRG